MYMLLARHLRNKRHSGMPSNQHNLKDSSSILNTRRQWLKWATSTMGFIGVAVGTIPLIGSFSPSERAKSEEGPTIADVHKLVLVKSAKNCENLVCINKFFLTCKLRTSCRITVRS